MDMALLQEFFLRSAARGWASGAEATTIGPNQYGYYHAEGELSCADEFVVNGDHSAGTTVISESDQCLWVMQYFGWSDASVLSFLQRALSQSYNAGRFIGGRGLMVEQGNLVYLNYPMLMKRPMGFHFFVHREKILQRPKIGPDKVLHWYQVQGGLLVNPE